MPDHHAASPSDDIASLLVANHRRFLAFVESRVSSREEAEEILQNAFVRSVEKSGEIRETESAVAWFYRVLRNAVVDHHRRQAAGKRMLDAVAGEATEADASLDPATERTICQCVKGLLPTLKPEYAEFITRVDLDGEDVGAVAEAMGISAGNGRVRLHRARAALRESVERTCRTCATHGCFDCTCASSEKANGSEHGQSSAGHGCCQKPAS